jgi:hypothetical protein
MHKTQNPSTSTKQKKKRKKERKQSSSKKQNKIKLCTSTLFFSWMSLLDALDFTFQDVSNPKERKRYK